MTKLCYFCFLLQPHFRCPLFEAPHFTWSVEWHTFGDAFHYFFYTLKKVGICFPPFCCMFDTDASNWLDWTHLQFFSSSISSLLFLHASNFLSKLVAFVLFFRVGGHLTVTDIGSRALAYHLLICYMKSWRMRIIFSTSPLMSRRYKYPSEGGRI